jgi:hypothetical protein
MKIFLSSTFLDLVEDREAVLNALRKKRASTLAMEDFLATPTTPSDTALENLRNSDVMILMIGFKAGSLLSDGSGRTYTWAEYDELLRLGRDALVFVKQERRWFERKTTWKNKEKDPKKKKALNEFKAKVWRQVHVGLLRDPGSISTGCHTGVGSLGGKGTAGSAKDLCVD